MKKIFSDDGHRIRVEETNRGTRFLVNDVEDIFPVIHYVETYPKVREGEIEVRRYQYPFKQSDIAETFKPELIPDSAGNTYSYQNYNFILLNSDMTHSFEQVVKDFAEFLSLMKKPRKRKLKIEDVKPEYFSSLLRIVKMKKVNSRREFYTYVRGEDNPEAVYLYSERFSDGLRNRLGFTGGFNKSPLVERIYIE